jgi:hypothetical protein
MRERRVQIPRFHARIDWASHREAPTGTRLVHPVWFAEDGADREGWSLVVTLTEPVAWGDESSSAFAHFLMPAAPHKHLRPGRSFDFHEGATLIGRVQLGEPADSVEVDA